MRKSPRIVPSIVLLAVLCVGGAHAQATRLVLRTGAGDSTVTLTAGQTRSLTITARANDGSVDTTYNGNKTLTFSGADSSLSPATAPTVTNISGTAIPFGVPEQITFVDGVATVVADSNGVMTLYRAQSTMISVGDGDISTGTGTDRLSVTVEPAAFQKFAWNLASPQVNGVAFTGTNTLTAQDTYGNTVTTFNANANNVTVTTSLSGTISGLGALNNYVLNQAGDFTSGVANMTTQGMKYTGVAGTGTFTATSATGSKTGVSSAVQVTAAPATRLVLRIATGDSVISLQAGTAQNLRITAVDANGNTDLTYTGAKSLTFSGANASPGGNSPTVSNSSGTAIAFGSATSITFSSGVATASGSNNGVMRLYGVQSGATISVTDGAIGSPGTNALTATVSPGGIGQFSWVLATPQTNGAAFTGADTLKALDSYGNTCTSFDASADTVTITTTLSGTITGLGAFSNNKLNRPSDFSSGIATLNGKMIYTGASGTGTFTATSNSLKSGISSNVVIGAGTATRFVVKTVLDSSSINVAAGVARGLKITAYDASGNIATSYTGSKNLRFFGANTSPDALAPTISDNTGTERNFTGVAGSLNTPLTFTSGVTTASGSNGLMRLRKVETAVVGASDGSITTALADRLTANVSPAGLGRFAVSLQSPQINGTAFTGVNTVTAVDSFGNTKTNFDASVNNVTMSTTLSGTITGLGSVSNNVMNQAVDFSSGVANVTNKIKYTGAAGAGTFSATSATGKTGTSSSVTMNVGSATRLVITGTGSQLAGASQNLTITARDSSGNVATSYTGDKLLKFSGSGPSPNPTTYPKVTDKDGTQNQFGSWLYITFANGVASVSGSANGVMYLYRAGKDTIAVAENTIGSGAGDRLIVTVTEDVLQKFVFALATPQQSGIAFNGTNTLTAQDNFGNTVTTFNPAGDNVTVSANSPLSGTVKGLGSGSNNILNQAGDFTAGVANLTGKMVFEGGTGSAPFTAVSASSKSGTSGTVQIVAGGATRLVISGVASMTAGGTQSLTITAKDASGNTVTTYTGAKSLTFSGADSSVSGSAPTVSNSSGTATPFGAATSINFTNGTATVSGANNGVLRLYRAQTVILAATDGTISSSGSDCLTIGVSPAALGRFSWVLASPQTNGVAFTGTNTLTAQDDYWNTVTTFNAATSNVTVTTSLSGTITGLGGTGTNIMNQAGDFVSGVANLTTLGLKYTGAIGSGTFTATSGGKSTTSSSIAIVAGTASRLVLRAAGGDSIITLTAGAPQNLVITAKDASGNTVASYAGDKTLTFSGADSSASPATAPTVSNTGGSDRAFGLATTISFVNGIASVTSSSNGVMKLYKAQSPIISVTDGTRSSTGNDRLSVTVNPASLDNFKLTLATPQVNGAAFVGTNTLIPRDAFGNTLTAFDASVNNVTLTTTLTGTITGLGTGSNNILNRSNDFASGVADLTSMGMKFTGTIGSGTFTATSAGKAGTSTTVEITPGGATRLLITGLATQIAGTMQTLTIAAKDASGNTVPTYTGVKTLTFSGANQATHPVTPATVTNNTGIDVPFETATPILFTNGVATTVLKLYKVETATVATTDGTIGAAGLDRLTVAVAPGTLGKFGWTLANPQVNGTAFTGVNTLTAQDDWGNVVPTFDASTNNVTLTTSLTPSTTAITGLGTLGNNVLNQASNFVLGVANLTNLGMMYTGPVGTGVFTATSTVGSKSGSSDSIVIQNPLPTITGITPGDANRLQSVLVTVTGTKFITGSTLLSLGADATVDSIVVLSPTQLTAKVRPGASATLGQRNVKVTNVGPGGGSDSLVNAFTIRNVPSVISLSPSNGVRGQSYDVTMTGTNFAEGVSEVGLLNAIGITLNAKTVTSPSTIIANITISPGAADGVRYFHVTNSGAYGGQSNLIGFTVGTNPGPHITSVIPSSGKRGATVTDTVRGTDFYNGITSVHMGQGIIVTGTTIDSLTRMRVTALITDTAATGPRHFIVENSGPGGGLDTLKNGFTVENPVPTLTGLSVQNASRLQTVNMTLTGTQFINNVTTVSAGANIAISGLVVESSTSLKFSLTVDSSATLGTRNITVANPEPGGGSATLQDALTINNPKPTLATIAPESTAVGGNGFSLTVTGTNFVPGNTVRIGGRVANTTLVNRTRMIAAVLASDIDTARSIVVDIVAPTPGGGTSESKNLVVLNPVPTLTGISPTSASKLQTLDVTFTGTHFLRGVTTVDVGGSDITVDSITVTDSMHLVAKITITATATMGARDVFVKNPAPGGGESQKRTFTVADNPRPTITGLTPNSWHRLGGGDVTVTGTNFISGVTSVDFGPGTEVNGLFVVNSSTSLTAGVTIYAAAATGARSVSVKNAEPGGGIDSLLNSFTVVNPEPKLDWVEPANGRAGDIINIVFYGKKFIEGVTSVSMGTGISATDVRVVSDTVITATIKLDSTATAGARDISVANLPPGGGISWLASGFVVGDNPEPTLASVFPTTGKRLQTLDIVFRGTNFVGGVTDVILPLGFTKNSLSIDSATGLTVNATISSTAPTGERTMIVRNGLPGGGIDSLPAAFVVTNPAPTLTSVNPTSGKRSQSLPVVLRGTNFIPASVPSFGGGGGVTISSVNVDSVRQMTLNITIADTATLGPRSITVTNPTPGGGTSSSVAFSINMAPPAAPTLTSPGNGNTNLPTTLVLKWGAVPNATRYALMLSSSQGFGTTIVDDSTLTSPQRQVGPLSNNVTYYWKARAINVGGSSEWSSTWSFTPLYPDIYPLTYALTFPSYATATQFNQTDYRIVGLPGASTNLAATYLTGTQGEDWQMYTDNGATSDPFVKYDGTSAFIFSNGKAYWLIKKNPWSVSTSVPTAALDTSISVRLQLHSGWNLITNPYLQSVPWASIQEANAPGAQNPIWAYGGVNGFSQSSVVDPYVGYYFYNTSNLSILRVPYGATSGVWRKPDTTAGNGWSVTVAALGEGYVDRALSFGVRDDAFEGYDKYDYQKPRGVGIMPSTAFRRPEFDSLCTSFASDFRPPVKTLTSWPFELRTPAKTPTTLQFEGLGQIPEEMEVYLIDYSHESSVNLRSEAAYKYTPPTPVGQFAVAVGTHSAMATLLENVGPKEFGLDNNFPNPFNPSTTFPVAVPHSAMVNLKIYNILGQEVRTLFAGQLDAGRHWIVWDGKNNAGAGVATGVYIARLTADAGVSIVKKLMLMK
jgi:hypothetical protein